MTCTRCHGTRKLYRQDCGAQGLTVPCPSCALDELIAGDADLYDAPNATPGPVEVTQADREAAWPFYRAAVDYPATHEFKANWMLGHLDNATIVQAFARHRIEAARPVSGEPVGYIIAEMLNRKSEFERNGIVMTASPQGMSTLPLYAARPVQSELVEALEARIKALRNALIHIEDNTEERFACSRASDALDADNEASRALSQYEDKETDNG